MFTDIWNMRLAQAGEAAATLRAEVRRIEKQIESFLDRIVEADSAAVIAAYEKRIGRLEREKALAEDRIRSAGKPRHTVEESFELALRFLSKPWNIWTNGNLAWKRTVLRLAFQKPLSYCRKQGLRTPNIALPFKVLAMISGEKCEMARWGGFEPPTP